MTAKKVFADSPLALPVLFCFLAALLLAVAAPAQEETSASEDSATVEAAEPEYEWIMDPERGRRYRVEEIPKIENAFKRVKENEVRFPGGATFQIVAEDEDGFHVKVYEKIDPSDLPPAVVPPKGPSEEEIKAVKATYQTDWETVDRFSLEPFDKGLPRSGQWRNGFDVADMNKDGHADIVFGAPRKTRPYPHVFLGDGEGNWTPWKAEYAQAPYDYGDVAVGDLDGDGHLDMVFGFHLRGLFVARGNGEGRFESWTKGVALDIPGRGGDATSFSSRAVEVFDWNQDGKLDIVALGEGPKGLKTRPDKRGNNNLINTSRGFLVYLNNGDGTWTPAPQEKPTTRRPNFGDDFAIADFDKDGLWDLVTTTRQLGVKTILAEVDEDKSSITYRNVPAIRARGFVDSVETGDMNGDGHEDIVLSYRSHELEQWRAGIDILYNQGNGEFESEALFVVEGQTGLNSIGLGNLNGDDRPDVVFSNESGALFVFMSEGEKGYVMEASEELDQKSEGCRGFDVTLIDVDGEEGDEVVVAFAGESTGYPGFATLSKPGCKREGSLRVWKAVAR